MFTPFPTAKSWMIYFKYSSYAPFKTASYLSPLFVDFNSILVRTYVCLLENLEYNCSEIVNYNMSKDCLQSCFRTWFLPFKIKYRNILVSYAMMWSKIKDKSLYRSFSVLQYFSLLCHSLFIHNLFYSVLLCCCCSWLMDFDLVICVSLERFLCENKKNFQYVIKIYPKSHPRL